MTIPIVARWRRAVCRRRSCRGKAMVEFVLMLPLMLAVCAMAIYVGVALFTKENTQINVRYRLWAEVRRNWWHHDLGWSWNQQNGRYEPSHEGACSWSDWVGTANGPIGTGAGDDEDRPRGKGDEIEYLFNHGGRDAQQATSDQQADDYFRRIWNNLPGRHHRERARWFEVSGTAYRWMNTRLETDYYADSVSWTHDQEPIWLIAMYGPMSEIKDAFERNLSNVPPEFLRMREEVLHAWFEESYLVSWNHWRAVQPQP